MYVEREIKNRFEKVAAVYPIVALVGARQAGKTTFLKEQAKRLNSSYLLFDDPDIRNLFEDDVKKFEVQYVDGQEISILDEVQYCEGAGQKLKYLADKGKKMWITASSEVILGTEVLLYLVGRVSIVRLYPFSIREFLESKGQKAPAKQALDRNIWEHITYGGYPKAVSAEDIELKTTILRDLYDTMVLKDIARTFSIEDIRSLEEFTKYLAVNIGGLVSYERVSNDIKISFQTIKKYLTAMEKSYLIIRVPPFYTNKTKEITKQPKIYFLDTGLRNTITKTFDTEPGGKLFENYVLSELVKIGFSPKHWRTKSKAEVDFVIEKDNEIIPIEVKLSANPDKVETSMHSFITTYKPKRAFVVTYKGAGGIKQVDNCKVEFVNILSLRKLL